MVASQGRRRSSEEKEATVSRRAGRWILQGRAASLVRDELLTALMRVPRRRGHCTHTASWTPAVGVAGAENWWRPGGYQNYVAD